jgi:glutamate racemase
MLPDMPVIGVVEPGASRAASVSKNQQIFVMATETTIASAAYQKNIVKFSPEAKIHGQACNLLVALAEEGMVDNEIAVAACQYYLQHLKDQDTVVLGCTHFPIFKAMLQKLLGPSIHIVDSGETTASALLDKLSVNQLLSTHQTPTVQYLVTDSIERFKKVGPLFLGHALDEAFIELVDIC